jgi:catechol 2,3-dioxygenase-like lactoylglutathione lyase family enzyme
MTSRLAFFSALSLSIAVTVASAQQRPAITGIAFARVYASDPFASDAFYRMLGFASEPPTDTLQRYQVSATQWIEVAPLPDTPPASRLAAVGFTTTDAAALQTYLKSKSIPIAEPLANGVFTVLDPEGTRVVFVQSGSNQLHDLRTGGVGDRTSNRILHVGFLVKSAPTEDHFWREILGFREYWHGAAADAQPATRIDWQSLQVPDGTDWIEYMLNSTLPADSEAAAHQLGVLDHFSLGTAHMPDVIAALDRNGCAAGPQAENCTKSKLGRDGKLQLNLFDPDQTRVEYMEFQPSGPTCCSEFKAKHPTPESPPEKSNEPPIKSLLR